MPWKSSNVWTYISVFMKNALSKSPVISVIVLNYNGCEHLAPCLSSILSCNSADNIDLIVVDNGSTDESVEMVRVSFPDVRIITSPSNLGFSQGANLGAAHARGEYLSFVNNDMRVDRNWLTPLIQEIESEEDVAC